jgi:IS1 family transposase
MDHCEDDCTWIWTAVDSASRAVLGHVVGKRCQRNADKMLQIVKKRLFGIPLFVSDGLKMYPRSILKAYGVQTQFPRTGIAGRPRMPAIVPPPGLRYAQVMKHQRNGHLLCVERRVIFGEVDSLEVTTSHVERCNLTMRQENRRLARKTLAFSRREEPLDDQMCLFFAYFNFCRSHLSLRDKDTVGPEAKRTPMMILGLSDHVWSMRELLTFPYHKTSVCN